MVRKKRFLSFFLVLCSFIRILHRFGFSLLLCLFLLDIRWPYSWAPKEARKQLDGCLKLNATASISVPVFFLRPFFSFFLSSPLSPLSLSFSFHFGSFFFLSKGAQIIKTTFKNISLNHKTIKKKEICISRLLSVADPNIYRHISTNTKRKTSI